jgi:hypothetical protein
MMTQMKTVYSVKVGLNGEFRRFSHGGFSYKELQDRIREVFQLPPNVDLVVRYVDDEGDLILMSSEQEMKEAVELSKNVLRLQATLKNQLAASTPVVAVAPVAASAVPVVAAPVDASDKQFSKEEKLRMKEQFKADKIKSKEERRLLKQQWREQKGMHKGGNWKEWRQGKEQWCGRQFPNHMMCNERKLVARHVKDVTVEDGTEIPAGTPFVKIWRIRNEGPAWPAGCRLFFISHKADNLGGPESVALPIQGELAQNQEIDVSVPLVAPSAPGRYEAFWKFCTPEGRKFGQRLWVSIVVPGSSSDESKVEGTDKYEELANKVLQMGFSAKKCVVLRMLNKHNGDVEKVVRILTKRGLAMGAPIVAPQ